MTEIKGMRANEEANFESGFTEEEAKNWASYNASKKGEVKIINGVVYKNGCAIASKDNNEDS